MNKEFLSKTFEGLAVYFVENKDDDFYNSVGIARTVFVPEQNKKAVYHKCISTGMGGLLDRDYLSDDDIQAIQKHYPGLRVLPYYSIENMMYHPDNLKEYYASIGKDFNAPEYEAALLAECQRLAEEISLRLMSIRATYPFYEEHKKKKGDKENELVAERGRFKLDGNVNEISSRAILADLRSGQLARAYRHLPMKTKVIHLHQRQNLPRGPLVRTEWFRNTMTACLKSEF